MAESEMAPLRIPAPFDWVTARKDCRSSGAFERIKEVVRNDVDTWKWQLKKHSSGHVKRTPRCCVVEATAR